MSAFQMDGRFIYIFDLALHTGTSDHLRLEGIDQWYGGAYSSVPIVCPLLDLQGRLQ